MDFELIARDSSTGGLETKPFQALEIHQQQRILATGARSEIVNLDRGDRNSSTPLGSIGRLVISFKLHSRSRQDTDVIYL
jgi:hypothetical protein